MDADRTGLPHGGAARVRRHKYFAQQHPDAGAIHLLRVCSIPLGWSDHRERNPKIRPSAFGRWPYFWCGHGDSNPNAIKHENLNLACLPISSCPHSNAILPQPRAGSKQKIAVRFLEAAETRKRRIFYFVLRLHNERETHGANPVSPAFLIHFRRAAAPPSGASFFRRTSASRCRTRRGWSGAASG